MDAALQAIKKKVFEEVPLPIYNMLDLVATFQQVLECFDIIRDQEANDLRYLHIPKTKSNQDIEGPEIEFINFVQRPLKTGKVNFGS